MKKPIIGVTLDFVEEGSFSARPHYAIRESYFNMIRLAGGIPIGIPFQADLIDEYLSLIDGIIIPGGDFALDPDWYVSGDGPAYPPSKRLSFDVEIITKALAKNIPFLGICYGMQLMNVLFGGSLIQDLPANQPIAHKQPMPKNMPWHDINIEAGSKLAQIAGTNLASKVNSTHHQAIDKIGQNLITCATAPDGIVEAIESINHKFAIGVEWHPEYQNTELDIAIFKVPKSGILRSK
jgi:putative glutamine amidotransferase